MSGTGDRLLLSEGDNVLTQEILYLSVQKPFLARVWLADVLHDTRLPTERWVALPQESAVAMAPWSSRLLRQPVADSTYTALVEGKERVLSGSCTLVTETTSGCFVIPRFRNTLDRLSVVVVT